MQKKLIVTVVEEVYEGLRKTIGPRKISRFIQELVRPHVVSRNLESAYAEMAKDTKEEGGRGCGVGGDDLQGRGV